MELYLEGMCLKGDINSCIEPWEIEYQQWQEELKKLKESDYVNFVNLPLQLEYVKEIKEWWEERKDTIKYYVNIGIGGSALGGKALVRSFVSPDQWECVNGEKVSFFFPDNVDPRDFKFIMENLPLEQTIFNVISKSGTTVETMSQMMIVWKELEKRDLLQTNMIFTTDPENGELAALSREYGIKKFTIPPRVGGRFSVLSPVGLIPAIIAGIDIEQLLEAASQIVEEVIEAAPEENPSLIFSAINFHNYNHGKNIIALLTYASPLNLWGNWFTQLWAESIGKKRGQRGVGSTPLPAVGVTDQHSILQLFLDGPRDKIVYFLGVKKREEDIEIPEIFGDREKISYLGGKSLATLMKVERDATILALKERKVPTGLIELESISEKSIGRMIMFFELGIFYAGKMFNINPFDQPAVEEIKKYIYGTLGRKGFEDFGGKIRIEE